MVMVMVMVMVRVRVMRTIALQNLVPDYRSDCFLISATWIANLNVRLVSCVCVTINWHGSSARERHSRHSVFMISVAFRCLLV